MDKELSSKYICKYCKCKFSSRPSLSRHTKTAKYCLKKRGQYSKLEKVEVICKDCGKIYSMSQSLKRHQRICKKREKRIEEEYERKIRKMEDTINKQRIKIKKYKNETYDRDELIRRINELEKMVANKEGVVEGIQMAPAKKIINKTTGTKNTYINPKLLNIQTDNIRPLTINTIQEDISSGKFTRKMFLRGVNGLVEFISNIITHENENGVIERNYACTDTSRYRFHRLIESKEWKEDNGAHYVNNILDSIKEPVSKFFVDIIDKRTDAFKKEDEVMREYYDNIITDTRLIYRGTKNKKCKERVRLFTKVRNGIKNVAFISSQQ